MHHKKRIYRYLVNLLPAIKRRNKLKVLYKRGKVKQDKRPTSGLNLIRKK